MNCLNPSLGSLVAKSAHVWDNQHVVNTQLSRFPSGNRQLRIELNVSTTWIALDSLPQCLPVSILLSNSWLKN